ncbi:MAG: hypothetical protein LBQ24_03285 [Candidatus Peribacteria bacterium]|nr:hypothetical protein [Candidatus Peribacteria bacterium]
MNSCLTNALLIQVNSTFLFTNSNNFSFLQDFSSSSVNNASASKKSFIQISAPDFIFIGFHKFISP